MVSQSGALQSLFDYLRGLRQSGLGLWGVAVELALIGAVVYAALRFLQGTRGARLLKSVGIILVTSFLVVRVVAEKLHLDRVIFLYPYFFGGVILTALIAFQPEIRRGLIRLGGARWLRFWTTASDPTVEPVVTVVSRLSQKKIGALIALQRSVGLDAIVESGVRIDAEVTSELLETIFWPGTVLHDMGVILQHGRIAAAACQFPIAESGDLALSLGSRHRAALGLSQESDALVIIVSEETGTISVAVHGQLHRHLTPDALKTMILGTLDATGQSAVESPSAKETKETARSTDGQAAATPGGEPQPLAADAPTES